MTYFHGSLPAPTMDFHAAVREFEAAAAENRYPSLEAISAALAEFADGGSEAHTLLYVDESVKDTDMLRELDHWDREVAGEDYEHEFRIFLAGLRDWVGYWDHYDYGW